VASRRFTCRSSLHLAPHPGVLPLALRAHVAIAPNVHAARAIGPYDGAHREIADREHLAVPGSADAGQCRMPSWWQFAAITRLLSNHQRLHELVRTSRNAVAIPPDLKNPLLAVDVRRLMRMPAACAACAERGADLARIVRGASLAAIAQEHGAGLSQATSRAVGEPRSLREQCGGVPAHARSQWGNPRVSPSAAALGDEKLRLWHQPRCSQFSIFESSLVTHLCDRGHLV